MERDRPVMNDPLRIDFIRSNSGKLASATCTTPTGDIELLGQFKVAKKGVTSGQHGLIYRMIIALADSGYEGASFEAHDGRMVCLKGVVNRKAVPVQYGGEKKDE